MITKYNQYIKESLLDKLKGPSKEEVWDSIGKDFFGLEKAPTTVDEFLDYIINNGEVSDEHGIYRIKFNNIVMFVVMKQMKSLYIYYKLYSVLDSFYDIETSIQMIDLVKNKLRSIFGEFDILPGHVMSLED